MTPEQRSLRAASPPTADGPNKTALEVRMRHDALSTSGSNGWWILTAT
jgi:hypothetical protein